MSKCGRLFYNVNTDRMDICFEDGSTAGGLHCGDCFLALIDGDWVRTRIEMSDHWYLVGAKDQELPGLIVKM